MLKALYQMLKALFRFNKTIGELAAAGVYPQDKVAATEKARVVRFSDADGDETWLGYQNFYVISRYNPRSKYAMANQHYCTKP